MGLRSIGVLYDEGASVPGEFKVFDLALGSGTRLDHFRDITKMGYDNDSCKKGPFPHSRSVQQSLDEGKEQGQETSEHERQTPAQATAVLPPSMPPEDAPWSTQTCLQLFDAWRGAPLLVASTRRKAKPEAVGLVSHYSREQIVHVYRAMSEDPYWAKQGGVDIEQVANHIARELKKLDHASARSPTTSSSPASREPAVNPYLARSLDKEHNARQLAKMRELLARAPTAAVNDQEVAERKRRDGLLERHHP
jgi:hypothetical protein